MVLIKKRDCEFAMLIQTLDRGALNSFYCDAKYVHLDGKAVITYGRVRAEKSFYIH